MSRLRMRSTKWSRTAGEPRPGLDLGHLFTKYKASQLISQLLDLLRVTGAAEAFRQLEERLLFLFLGFDSLLDEFHQHAIVAEIALLFQSLDLSGDLGRQGYASSDMLCAR